MTKTQGTVVLTHQVVTHQDTVKGSAQDVTTKLGATIVCFHGFIEAVANTDSGSFLIQVSASGSGDEDWVTVAKFATETGTPDFEDLTATEASGETVLAVALTAGFAAGDLVYIEDTGTLADSEWGLLEQIVTDTSVDLVDGLTTGKDSADNILNKAEIFSIYLDLTAVGRLRVLFQHEGGTGANVHVKAIMVTGDSIG